MPNGLARGRRNATSCPPAQRDVVPATIQPDTGAGPPSSAGACATPVPAARGCVYL